MLAGCMRTMTFSKALSEAPQGITIAIARTSIIRAAMGSTSPITTLPTRAMYAAKSIASCSALWRNDAGVGVLRGYCGEDYDAARNWMIWVQTRSSPAHF
jgi:hypothetical protein